MRTFTTGATRDTDDTKPDYEGFLSPLALVAYGEYMTKNRQQADGNLRASDNWQKGIPLDVYMKSAWRHFLALWLVHRGHSSAENIQESCCAVLFNIQGYLHEVLKAEGLATKFSELSDDEKRLRTAINVAEPEDDTPMFRLL